MGFKLVGGDSQPASAAEGVVIDILASLLHAAGSIEEIASFLYSLAASAVINKDAPAEAQWIALVASGKVARDVMVRLMREDNLPEEYIDGYLEITANLLSGIQGEASEALHEHGSGGVSEDQSETGESGGFPPISRN